MEREREREERGPVLTDTTANKLLYFKHWKIPINFEVNALLYSKWWKRGFNVSSNTLLRHLQTDSWPLAVKPPLCCHTPAFIGLLVIQNHRFWDIFFHTMAHEYDAGCVRDSTLRS